MEVNGYDLSGVIDGVDGELEAILEGVRQDLYPNVNFSPDMKKIALATARRSSRAAARATAQVVKEVTVGVETRTQSFPVVFNIATAQIPANVELSFDVNPDTSYDLVTGMLLVMDTPDPAPAQITPGTFFNPYVGLKNDTYVIKDPAPRAAYMIDVNGTTPVSDRFSRLDLDLQISTGRNLKILAKFVNPGVAFATIIAPGNPFFGFTVVLELSRAKRKVRAS